MVPKTFHSKNNTQKNEIKIGDIVEIVKFNFEQTAKLYQKDIAIVLSARMFNNDEAKLIMKSDGAKEWIRKDKIETILSL